MLNVRASKTGKANKFLQEFPDGHFQIYVKTVYCIVCEISVSIKQSFFVVQHIRDLQIQRL